jgi:SAM-dependent methyltransferase
VEEVLFDQFHRLEEGHWWFRGRRAVIRALTRRASPAPHPRILDAGCGTGRNLEEYARLGRAVGVEPARPAVEYCRARGIEVHEGTLDELPFEDASFDLIFASDVLEHIEDDVEAMRELRRVAAPRARFVITVPAYTWLWSHHDDRHHHVRRYTRGLIETRTRLGGWEPVYSSYFNTVLLAPIAVTRAVQRLRPPPEATDYELTPARLSGLLELPMRAEAELIGRGGRLPAGVSIGLVCRPAALSAAPGSRSRRSAPPGGSDRPDGDQAGASQSAHRAG